MRFQIHGEIEQQPRVVYRFFDREEHADALCSGQVWISTLETCRRHENPEQGDAGEATYDYDTGEISGSLTDPSVVLVAQRAGIRLEPVPEHKVTIKNCRFHEKLRDAFVVCTTTDFTPGAFSASIGRYCVRIASTELFYQYVTAKLRYRTKLYSAWHGHVTYRARQFSGLENPPGRLGFVKPPDQYAHQKEYRFMWLPRGDRELHPFQLWVPSVASLCTKIS